MVNGWLIVTARQFQNRKDKYRNTGSRDKCRWGRRENTVTEQKTVNDVTWQRMMDVRGRERVG